MEIRTVEAGRGAGWFGDGWRGFARQPGMWILMLLVFFGIQIALGLFPVIGGLASALIAPALAGGMYLGAARLREGERLEMAHLFAGLTDAERRGPMLTLGAISIGFTILLIVVMFVLIGGAGGMGAMTGADEQAMQTLMGGGAALGGLVMLALMVVFWAAMTYAIPLAMFGRETPVAALGASLRGCLRNIPALLIFGLIFIALAIVASIPLLLGWLVLAPVGFVAVYQSYLEIFPPAEGNGAESAEDTMPPIE